MTPDSTSAAAEGGSVPSELHLEPPLGEWAGAVERNRSAAEGWDFEVAGRPAHLLRQVARTEALDLAVRFSARLPVAVAPPRGEDAPIVFAGHQPGLYHPGVWVKCFALQRIADELGATPVDLVVDSDGFESVGVSFPCAGPPLQRCVEPLVDGAEDACFACTPPPGSGDIERFRRAASQGLSTLAPPVVIERFERFCDDLSRAAGSADNMAEAVTFARRSYEATAGTSYLELPMTHLGRGQAFAAFVAHVALEAERFARDYNSELADYRRANKTRSAAQPVPDLRRHADAVELPFWVLSGDRREPLWARPHQRGATLLAGERHLMELPADGPAAASALHSSGVGLAPKALTLTMFVRMFCSDLLIHGRGGARYDRVTDGVIRRFFGVEAPAFVVASATVRLPLEVPGVTDADVSSAAERLNRLTHHPDEWLSAVGTVQGGEGVRALVGRKAELVAAIAAPGADRKSLGIEIKSVNAELAAVLEPVRLEMQAELDRLTEARRAAGILGDRTYPFCLFDPVQIGALVR